MPLNKKLNQTIKIILIHYLEELLPLFHINFAVKVILAKFLNPRESHEST